MRRKSISIDETKDQEDDLIFHWVDEPSFKKKVSFSNVVNLCLIETRKELNFASFNMYMNDYQYNSIRAEFQKHYDTFIKSNPQYKMKSRDEMTRNICEFIEQSKEVTA